MKRDIKEMIATAVSTDNERNEDPGIAVELVDKNKSFKGGHRVK